MSMTPASGWSETRTFFPIFERYLAEEAAEPLRVLVVGASDGKFVAPLVKSGCHVVAIDVDGEALSQIEIGLSGQATKGSLEVRVADVMDLDPLPVVDACWTSCSWHYSRNFSRPLQRFIDRMTAALADGGVFGVEFMMPVAVPHVRAEHYLEPARSGAISPGSPQSSRRTLLRSSRSSSWSGRGSCASHGLRGRAETRPRPLMPRTGSRYSRGVA